MKNGWIKIHRKLVENPIAKKPNFLALWIHLLMLANHDKTGFIWNGKQIILNEGELITGRKKLAELSGISESSIERILNYLENEHQIEQQKTTKYRLITIINWTNYQKLDSKSDNRRTTNGQQTDTYKNVKKDKNDKKCSAEGAQIIKEFISIDPKNQNYYGNTTQRKACDFLLSTYGFESVKKVIDLLPQINSQKLYIKKITTPYELMENWVKIGYALKEKKIINNIAFI